MNYYQHHIGDYLVQTSHLTFIEDAAYSRLLRLYYYRESPFPSDISTVQRLSGARSKVEKAAVETVLQEFFILQDDGWHNPKADEEITRYQSTKEAAQENGKKGGLAKVAKAKEEKSQGQAPASSTASESVPPLEIRSSESVADSSEGLANQQPITNNQYRKEYPPTPRKRGASFDAAQIELPDWINAEDWQAWVADRKARKKPVTREAAKRLIQQLDGYRAEGFRPSDVIAHSIAAGYQGLYPPKPAARARPPSRAQALADWNDELTRELQSHRATVIDMGIIDATC